MKKCLKCCIDVKNEDIDYCESCTFEKLKMYIKELYEKQVKKKQEDS